MLVDLGLVLKNCILGMDYLFGVDSYECESLECFFEENFLSFIWDRVCILYFIVVWNFIFRILKGLVVFIFMVGFFFYFL